MITNNRAFTLIELLIVVAIIAILAAIAVPNFLEAQTRSKVSRAKADMRSLATAIEAYKVDTNRYPPDGDDVELLGPPSPGAFDVHFRLSVLSTPISFMSSIPFDPFNISKKNTGNPMVDGQMNALFPGESPYVYIYNTFGNFTGGTPPGFPYAFPANAGNPNNYTLSSIGPNQIFDSAVFLQPVEYDPTNGTISIGDINRTGGERVVIPSFP